MNKEDYNHYLRETSFLERKLLKKETDLAELQTRHAVLERKYFKLKHNSKISSAEKKELLELRFTNKRLIYSIKEAKLLVLLAQAKFQLRSIGKGNSRLSKELEECKASLEKLY